jgi:hypothetical protein
LLRKKPRHVILTRKPTAHNDLAQPLAGLTALIEGVVKLGLVDEAGVDQQPPQRDAGRRTRLSRHVSARRITVHGLPLDHRISLLALFG